MSSNTYFNFILERSHSSGLIILDKPGKTYTCGRGKENQILCLSLMVSRKHCLFFRNDNEIYVMDLESSNGIYVNDVKQQARHMVKLNDNDIIGIGCPDSMDKSENMFIYKVRFVSNNNVSAYQSPIESPKESSCDDIMITNIDERNRSSFKDNVNNTNSLVSSNDISELPKVINKTCQIETSNKEFYNETSKINSHPEIVLLNISTKSNIIKQNTTHLDGNYNSECRRKNKNLSGIKSAQETIKRKDPLKRKTNDFESVEENDVLCIDDSPISVNTKEVKLNHDNNKIMSESIPKIRSHETNLVYVTHNNDANIHTDASRNIQISETVKELENVVHDNSKEYNEPIMTKNTLNMLNDKSINIVHNGYYFIKMEEEIIITDDDEIENNINNSKSYTESIIKLKQVKQEPKLRFSEVDIVNISDDEDNVFPCSQLFDSNIDLSYEVKKEMKRENNNNHDEDINRIDDSEIIISLSDSEDEDNKWLDRLSRSQLLNDEPLDTNIIDKDIKNIKKISNINDSSNKLSANIKSKKDNRTEDDKKGKDNNIKDKDKRIKKHKSTNKLHTIEKDVPDISCDIRRSEIDHGGTSNKEQEDVNNKSSHSLEEKQNVINNSTNNNVLKRSLLSKEKITIARKRPQIIDPPHMPVKRKRKIINDINTTTIVKEKQNDNLRVKNKKKSEALSPRKSDFIQFDKQLLQTPLSKEEKKKIAENRKNKLKKIAVEDKKESNIKPMKNPISKAIAKVSLRTRSDFLIDDMQSNTRNTISKSTKRKFPENKEYANSSNLKNNNNTLASNVKDINDAQLNKINETSEKNKNIESTATNNLKDKSNSNIVRIQKENCSPNRQGIAQLKKKKKRVSFKTVPEIREYEIESSSIFKKLVGKDAPIPVDKLSSKKLCDTNYSKLEIFFLRIFFWNPIWLEEQRRLNRRPPILKDNEIHPMLTYYKSYNDYYKIAEPLLLLEIWSGITKEFEEMEKNSLRPTVMCSTIERSLKSTHITSVNLCLSTLSVQVLITEENFLRNAYPNYGDLVVFEYVRNEKGKHMFHKVFAYVTNMNNIIITPFTEYNKDLENYVIKPYALLTYTLMTRNVADNFVVKRIQRIRTVTYLRSNIRMIQAIQYLPQSPLLNLILYPLIEAFQLPEVDIHLRKSFTKDTLNKKQLEAVCKVSSAVFQKEPKICLIQGPPGTGKSRVIVNIITEILYGNNRYQNNKSPLRILVCAPSNAAIDEIVLRLLAIRATIKEKRFKMVRIGRPEVMHTTVKDISLTELGKRDVKRMTANYSSKNIPIDSFDEEKKLLEARINALKCEITYSQKIDETYRQHLKLKLLDMNAKYELLKNHKSMDDMSTNELANFQRVAERRVLEGADIITCTLSSCYTNQMESIFGGNREKISVCIVDEATQCCEAENLIPLLLGVNKLILVGDPNQLPATIISQEAKKYGLDQSLFFRIQNAFQKMKDNPIIMLNTQYRMAHAISYWPNKFFYGGQLKNDIPNVNKFPFHNYRIFNINSNQNGDKFSNTSEAEFVSNLILCMMVNFNFEKWESNVSIGVLTPYNNQKHLISEKLNAKLLTVPDSIQTRFTIEINTIDRFQGQERDIILMSCVRSSGIGFLSNPQRLCVALTRARHCLIICGNFTTFMRDTMWNALISDSKLRKVYDNIDVNANLYEINKHIDRQQII
ncbi:helicase sen1 [Polistes fuscatus]|uniref:helicase sen1 n=1 Tax=Polistes fuscatus TaxID=30207 RepID=UPI001CA852A0|nr:helicase sen1 [Polistes fuscatus]